MERVLLRSLVPMKFIQGETERQIKDKELFEVRTADLPLTFQIVTEVDVPNRERRQITYNMVLRYK